VTEARNSARDGEFKDTSRYQINKYQIAYSLIAEDYKDKQPLLLSLREQNIEHAIDWCIECKIMFDRFTSSTPRNWYWAMSNKDRCFLTNDDNDKICYRDILNRHQKENKND